ncbi:MAG: MBL fold metallo-hydrolase [Synergistaceae bacterium]|nr:MBL fold metallo-hydrolase [Synergistaceae bacterium]
MNEPFSYPDNFLRFLGTGGARFTMLKQIRKTGGIWFSYGGLNGVIDPGPGSLYHMCRSVPSLDPHKLRAIILTHRHLDHSTDINVAAEAMTGGGFEKQGTVLLPEDSAAGSGPVLLRYIAQKVGSVAIAKDGQRTDLGMGVSAEPVMLIHHGVDCFGYIFRKDGLRTWGIISDTKPLESLAERYRECSFVSLNVTFPNKKPRLDHMSAEDAGDLLQKLHPELALMTHLGVVMIEAGPEKYAKMISTPQTRVIAGEDGMIIDLNTLAAYSEIRKGSAEISFRAIDS